jgi:release factor glutamine methyltransferase
VRARIEKSGHSVNSREEADRVFRERLGLSPSQRIQFARGEVGPAAFSAVDEAVARRETGVPLAYCLGCADFCGESFLVTPDVLIPRPDTEWLVQCFEEWMNERRYTAKRRDNERVSLLDLGCGSGCIGLTLALRYPRLKVTLADVSPPALEVARENALRLGVAERCGFKSGDWFDWAQKRERFDAILINPPYVRRDDPRLEEAVRAHEPAIALFLDEDPEEFFFRLVRRSAAHLAAGGLLAIEVGYDTAWPCKCAYDKVNAIQRGKEMHDFHGLARVIWGVHK